MSELAAKIMVLKAALIDGAPHRATGWEWCKALDEILGEVRAEAGSPAPRGDATDSIRAALTECIGRMPPDEAVASFVDELSRRGFYVVDRARFDATRRAEK